jgi:hypothetical protein
MTSITDIPISDIKLFLSKNNVAFNTNTAYDTTWKLLQKGVNFSNYNNSIIEWLKAYNLIVTKVDVPSYAEFEINNMSTFEKENLAKLLGVKENQTSHIINILRYMGKLKILNDTQKCDEFHIEKAIDEYWADIYLVPIKKLEKEYGSNAFNYKYLNIITNSLRIPNTNNILLGDIIDHALLDYEFEYAENINDKTFKISWEYTKCLMRILQSDTRTRNDFDNIVTDEQLGIIYDNGLMVCNEDGVMRAIDKYGEKLFNIPIKKLEKEYGPTVFNPEYLYNSDSANNAENLYDIVRSALRKDNFVKLSGDKGEYIKCLLRIFQTDYRTYMNFHNMVSDEDLEI